MSLTLDQRCLRPIVDRFSTALVLAILVSNTTVLVIDHGGLFQVHVVGTFIGLLTSTALIGLAAYAWPNHSKSFGAELKLISHAQPLGLLLHGLVDGLILGTAWHFGVWHGLIALAALLLHEIPHLWAQHRIWKLGRPTSRRILTWLSGLTAAGLITGIGISLLLNGNDLLLASEIRRVLVWMIGLLMIVLGTWTWKHQFNYQPVRMQLGWLVVGLMFAIPLAWLHIFLHHHSH